ncbi:MAG: YbgC/FadM family acyl-CoA thioesterase [Polyangiaceae bacterium]|nr:YbgC/FadM family acyl-CoA thioesterase [Polyangiaceae bacterium]
MEYALDVKVYYEDTDCMGVVYHANYLRYLERARTEIVDCTGTTIRQWADNGFIFPIYSVNIAFKAPAVLGDTLRIRTKAYRFSSFRVVFDQVIERPSDGKLIVEARVESVCTTPAGKLREYPEMGVADGNAEPPAPDTSETSQTSNTSKTSEASVRSTTSKTSTPSNPAATTPSKQT